MYKFTRLFMLLASLFLMSGCENDTLEPYQPGAIEGHIRFSEDEMVSHTELDGIDVFIRGSNLVGHTDTDGYFLLLDVPPGSYELIARSRASGINYEAASGIIEVEQGVRTAAPDLILERYPKYQISNFILIDDLYDWFYGYNRTEIITPVHEYRVMGAVRDAYYQTPIDTLITVWHNETRVVVDAPKNAFQTRITLVDGFNAIYADVGDVTRRGIGSDSIFTYVTPNQNELYIRLRWKTINYDSVSAGDLDLYLINLETADTCWYRNRTPDWGSLGALSDNPYLYDAINQYGNNDAYEYLRLKCIPNGEYQIHVNYNQNGDSDTVRVLANMKYYINDAQIDSLWSDAPMQVGETWIAGAFNIDNSIEWD